MRRLSEIRVTSHNQRNRKKRETQAKTTHNNNNKLTEMIGRMAFGELHAVDNGFGELLLEGLKALLARSLQRHQTEQQVLRRVLAQQVEKYLVVRL